MVTFQGKQYSIIEKFDCRILDFWNKEGSNIFTVLPISPLNYRKKHPTRAKVEIHISWGFTIFLITTDWGTEYRVEISNDMKEEIKKAIYAAKKQGLCKDTKLIEG